MINSLGASGGAEHGLVREITRFSPAVEQQVVRLYEKDQLDDALMSSGIEVSWLGLSSAHGARNWPLGARRLSSLIGEFRPDVIHTSLFAANLVGQAASLRRKVPILSTFTLSGDVALLRRHQPGASSRKAAVIRSISGRYARRSNAQFRALTLDALRTNCALLGVPETRAAVIPRGVPSDLAARTYLSREELGLPVGPSLLVNVGRQTAQKGHVFLLRSLAKLLDEADWHLVVVGREGEVTGEIKATIKELGLESNVTLTGYTKHVHDYMSHADVFAFPSYMEGLGTAVLEAMAMGLPIVAFDIAPVREVTDGGRLADLVPIDDLSSFVERVEAGLDRPGEFRREAQDWVRSGFGLDLVAEAVEERLRHVASL